MPQTQNHIGGVNSFNPIMTSTFAAGAMNDLTALRDQVAAELGVQFGSREHNRNLTTAQCGQVGGEMVRRALAQVWGNRINYQ